MDTFIMDEEYQIYLDERKILVQAKKESSHFLDKAILTLSSGFLGLSITFINNIVPSPSEGSIIYLVISWATFLLSIIFTLTSFITSQKACDIQINIIENQLANPENAHLNNKYTIATDVINYISISFFIIGIIFLIIFTSVNLISIVK